MTDTNVTIAAKRGCSDTGITEELATKLYNRARGHKETELYAIVRFTGSTTTEDVSGASRSLNLAIAEIEPVVDGKLNGELVEHVRTIQHALFRNRKLAEGSDEALPFGEEDGPAPAVAAIIQRGQPFVVDEDELAAQEAEDAAEDEADAADEEAEEADPYVYVHSSVGAAPGADTACGLRATIGKSLHTNKDRDQVGCPECLSALDATWDDDTATPTTKPFSVVP